MRLCVCPSPCAVHAIYFTLGKCAGEGEGVWMSGPHILAPRYFLFLCHSRNFFSDLSLCGQVMKAGSHFLTE